MWRWGTRESKNPTPLFGLVERNGRRKFGKLDHSMLRWTDGMVRSMAWTDGGDRGGDGEDGGGGEWGEDGGGKDRGRWWWW